MPPQSSAPRAADPAASYYCAACLHAVPRDRVTRQAYRDGVAGVAGVEVWLLRCPVCGLALDADVVPRTNVEATPSK